MAATRSLIRAIVIDPAMRTVYEHHIEPTLDAIRDVIGTNGCIKVVPIATGDRAGPVVWVDEEGLLKDLQYGWVPIGWGKRAIMGKGVVTELDFDGYPTPTNAAPWSILGMVDNWHKGESPPAFMSVWSVGDNCQMCDQRKLDQNDLIAAFSTGRALCGRCRRA